VVRGGAQGPGVGGGSGRARERPAGPVAPVQGGVCGWEQAETRVARARSDTFRPDEDRDALCSLELQPEAATTARNLKVGGGGGGSPLARCAAGWGVGGGGLRRSAAPGRVG
jgi:hypothetical protein